MEEIHAKGLVHLDLKSDNVMVQRIAPDTFEARIIDVGLATMPGNRMPFHNVDLQKINWMCPQVAQGGPVTFAADVYSLGRLMTDVQKYLQVHPSLSVVLQMARHSLAEDPHDRPTLTTLIAVLRWIAE